MRRGVVWDILVDASITGSVRKGDPLVPARNPQQLAPSPSPKLVCQTFRASGGDERRNFLCWRAYPAGWGGSSIGRKVGEKCRVREQAIYWWPHRQELLRQCRLQLQDVAGSGPDCCHLEHSLKVSNVHWCLFGGLSIYIYTQSVNKQIYIIFLLLHFAQK